MTEYTYTRETVSLCEFRGILETSGLAKRRPIDDDVRLQSMLDNADLIVTARQSDSGLIVGIARSLTDWCYATYLSDLAVDESCKGLGIGQRLIDETRVHAGPDSMLLLISAPGAIGFYEKVGMPRTDRAFMFPHER